MFLKETFSHLLHRTEPFDQFELTRLRSFSLSSVLTDYPLTFKLEYYVNQCFDIFGHLHQQNFSLSFPPICPHSALTFDFLYCFFLVKIVNFAISRWEISELLHLGSSFWSFELNDLPLQTLSQLKHLQLMAYTLYSYPSLTVSSKPYFQHTACFYHLGRRLFSAQICQLVHYRITQIPGQIYQPRLSFMTSE